MFALVTGVQTCALPILSLSPHPNPSLHPNLSLSPHPNLSLNPSLWSSPNPCVRRRRPRSSPSRFQNPSSNLNLSPNPSRIARLFASKRNRSRCGHPSGLPCRRRFRPPTRINRKTRPLRPRSEEHTSELQSLMIYTYGLTLSLHVALPIA